MWKNTDQRNSEYRHFSRSDSTRETFKQDMVNETTSQCPTLFLMEALVNHYTLLLLTAGLFGHVLSSAFISLYRILLRDSYTGFYYWILFHIIKSLFPLPVVGKMQLYRSSLIVENLYAKFILKLHKLLHLFIKTSNKQQRRG